MGDSSGRKEGTGAVGHTDHFSPKEEIFSTLKGLCDQTGYIIEEWKWYHWLLYFFFIPMLLLIAALQAPEIKTQFLVLDTSHPSIETLFLMNYTHSILEHMSNNLMLYLLSVTAIFFLEGKKKVFLWSTILFLIILPIFLSIPALYFFDDDRILLIQGFSGITCAFLGYACYSISRSVYSNFVDSHIKNWQSHGGAGKLFIIDLMVLISFLLLIMMLLGFVLGIFTIGDGYQTYGIGHFIGYIFGYIAPIAIGLVYNRRYPIFNSIMAVYIFGTMYVYYMYLLNAPI